MRKIIILFLISVGFGLVASGCSVYKIDIQQGNTLEPEKIAQLKPGMTQQQVQFLLGTPLVMDPFHANRWDYVYTFTPSGEKINRQHLTLIFKGNSLDEIDKSQLTGYVRPKASFKMPKVR